MQRNNGSNNPTEDKKNDHPAPPGGLTENVTAAISDTPTLDCSEQAEDKDIATLSELMKPLAAQLFPPPVSRRRGYYRRSPAEAVQAPMSEEQKGKIEELKQIPNYIKEFLINPAFLEEYAREEYASITILGRIPNQIIGQYLGYSPEYIASLLTSETEKQKEAIAILKRLRNRLVAQAEVDRRKAAPKTEGLMVDLMMTDIEHPELALLDTMSKFSVQQKARIVAVDAQYWKAGYFAIHQPESSLYRIVESHFNNYGIKPDAATCVFSGLVPLSSNAVPTNPLCWMHDVIVQISPGMHSKMVTYVKNGANIKIMGSIGIDHTEYQKFFQKMSTERTVETKDQAEFDASKGAQGTHIGAAHVVTQSARTALLDGVFKYLPTPEPFLVPEDHIVLFVSFQTDAFTDLMIKGSNGTYTDYSSLAPIKNKKGEIVAVHSGDCYFGDFNLIELNNEKRKNPSLNSSQIMVYVPQKAGREVSHHHTALAGFSGSFIKGVRQSGYAFIVKPTKDDLNNLLNYLSPGMWQGLFGQAQDPRFEAAKIVQKLTNGVTPFFALPSTDPYADAEAWGFEPLSIYYDGQKTYVNVWGLPLKFQIRAGGGTGEWNKFVYDLDRIVEFDHNKTQRQMLVQREEKAKAQDKKADKGSTAELSIVQLAEKHDELRDATARLITHKVESKEQESLILNPAMLCYQKLRQEVINQISPQLMSCYIKAELEAEMIQREKARVAEVKNSLEERRRLNALQVKKEIAARQKADPSTNIMALTQQLLAKKEEELTRMMQERKDLNLQDFYQSKFREDMALLKLDISQCHRKKLHESIEKLAKSKMGEIKSVMQDLVEEDDGNFNRDVGIFQASIKEGLNAFCEEEAKAREAKQETAKEKLEREAREAKENPADKETRLAKEAAEKSAHVATRKQALVEALHHPISQMAEIIKEKIVDLGFANLVSDKEIADRLVSYLWSIVEIKLQAQCSSALRGLFKGKLPINETDMGEETIDAKTELSRLANVDNAILFDCTLKQQALTDSIKNPDVLAKIGKFTAFAFMIFKAPGEEVNVEQIAGASKARYVLRAVRQL